MVVKIPLYPTFTKYSFQQKKNPPVNMKKPRDLKPNYAYEKGIR